MTTLRAQARRLAEEAEAYCATSSMHKYSADRIESAILAFAKKVLERESSEEILDVGADAYFQKKQELGLKTPIGPLLECAFRVVTAELLKELE